MDVLQADIEKEANFELQQRRWKHTFEAHGIIARRGKTEYMHMHRPENEQTHPHYYQQFNDLGSLSPVI